MKLINLHKRRNIDFYTVDTSTELELSIVSSGISVGVPSPVDDFLDLSIDLNKHLVKNPSTTFYGRVRGDSMIDAGINIGRLHIKGIEIK